MLDFSIKSLLLNIARFAVNKTNYRLTRVVDVDVLKQFFDVIKPIQTNHNLIRVGGKGDGGYLIPDDLENIKVCFSPGVDVTANF